MSSALKYIDLDGVERTGAVWSDAHKVASKWVIPTGEVRPVLVGLRTRNASRRWYQLNPSESD